MKLNDVKRLLSQKEHQRLELKKTTGQLERGMETVCAFLNGEGGTVLFGINDKGDIVGQEVADSTKRSIAEHIAALEPSAPVKVSYISLPSCNRQLIAMSVASSRMERPFLYRGRAYMRVESTTTTMPQHIYEKLLLERSGINHSWESFVNPKLSVNDLNVDEILKTVRLGIECGRLPESTGTDIEDILNRLELSSEGVLRNAAAVLFAKKEMGDYFQCGIRLARFRGSDKSVFIDNEQIQGNVFELLDAAMSFAFKHLSLSGVVSGLEREEHLSVPYKALREAVINAICHRDYRQPGASVGMAIYDDRVEIENPGYLPTDWKLAVTQHKTRSNPPNPLIANALYKRKTVEKWGRGIELMINECKQQGLPEPDFAELAGFVTVCFHYRNESLELLNNYLSEQAEQKTEQAEPKTEQAEQKTEQAEQKTGQAEQKTGQEEKKTGQVAVEPSRQVKALLACLSDNMRSLQEIMLRLDKKGRSNFLKNYIWPALSAGLIAREFPDQVNHSRQRYYLTEKGKACLRCPT